VLFRSLVLVLIMGIISFKLILPWYDYNETLYLAGKQVERLTPKNSLVVTIQNSGNTNFLYYSNRRGWRINLQYVEPEMIEEFRKQGASYFVAIYPGDLKRKQRLQDYLFRYYEPMRYSLEYMLFRIDKKLDSPAYLVTAPAISHPLEVKFDNDYVLLGYDLEKEKVLPGESNIVTYYWKTLKPHQIPADIYVNVELQTNNQPVLENQGRKWFYRLFGHSASFTSGVGKWISPFVYHIANPGSWVIYYSKPAYPSDKWQPGEIIKLSYEIFIPPDAPLGIYQVRPGVNVEGRSLKIEPATIADNKNRVVGAQIEILRHPEYVYKPVNKLDEMQRDILQKNDVFELSEVINDKLLMSSFSPEYVTKITQRYNYLLYRYATSQGFAMDSTISFIGYSVRKKGNNKYKLYFMFRANERIDKDWMLYVHAGAADQDVALLPESRQQYKYVAWDFSPELPTSEWQKQGYVIISREIFTKLLRFDMDIGWYRIGDGRFGKSVRFGWMDLSTLGEGFHDYSDIQSNLRNQSALFGLFELQKDIPIINAVPPETKLKIEQQSNPQLKPGTTPKGFDLNAALSFKECTIKKVALDRYKMFLTFQTKVPIDKDWLIYVHAKVADNNVAFLPPSRQPYKSENWDFKPNPPTSQWQKHTDQIITSEFNAKPIPYDLELGFYRFGELNKYDYFGKPVKLGWINFKRP
jgi:hypothetical protein